MLRLSYFPLIWKLSTVILIPKPNRPKTSHLLQADKLTPNSSKTVQKNNTQKNQTYYANSQFGFRATHSTVHQIHRLTDKISSSFEMKQFCLGVFLDVAQDFDCVWHVGSNFFYPHHII